MLRRLGGGRLGRLGRRVSICLGRLSLGRSRLRSCRLGVAEHVLVEDRRASGAEEGAKPELEREWEVVARARRPSQLPAPTHDPVVIEVAADDRDAEGARGVDGAVVNGDGNEVRGRDGHADDNRRNGLDVLIRLCTVRVCRSHDNQDQQGRAAELNAERLAGIGVALDFVRAAVNLRGRAESTATKGRPP